MPCSCHHQHPGALHAAGSSCSPVSGLSLLPPINAPALSLLACSFVVSMGRGQRWDTLTWGQRGHSLCRARVRGEGCVCYIHGGVKGMQTPGMGAGAQVHTRDHGHTGTCTCREADVSMTVRGQGHTDAEAGLVPAGPARLCPFLMGQSSGALTGDTQSWSWGCRAAGGGTGDGAALSTPPCPP